MLWALFWLKSGWSGEDLGSPFLLYDMCQASRGMGKMFMLYILCHSCGLKRAHGWCIRLLTLPDQYHWCNNKVQTHCSISQFAICNEASTSQCKVTCAKASNKHDAEWHWVKWWRCRPSKQQYGLWSNICRSLFFQWSTPADSRGLEWYRLQSEPVKEASWTFRLQVKELESSAPGH